MNTKTLATPVVIKFGGSTFEPITNLLMVADHISSIARAGHQMVICTSAPAGVTERQCAYIEQLSGSARSAGIDAMSTLSDMLGARVLSHALNTRGVTHAVLPGDRIGVYTDATAGAAKVMETRPEVLRTALARHGSTIGRRSRGSARTAPIILRCCSRFSQTLRNAGSTLMSRTSITRIRTAIPTAYPSHR